jgi:hypothetical protein
MITFRQQFDQAVRNPSASINHEKRQAPPLSMTALALATLNTFSDPN